MITSFWEGVIQIYLGYNTILPKYQTLEIKKTIETFKKPFDSIMISGIVFLGPKKTNIDTKIV